MIEGLPTRKENTVRKYIHELLHAHEVETRPQHFVRIVLASLIVFSIVCVMLETVEDIYDKNVELFYVLEFGIVIIFSVEYLLRVWSAVEEAQYSHPVWGRLRYMISILSIIDLMAILPFYIPHLISTDLRFLRGIRLIRLLRVLKLGEYSKGFNTISAVLHKKRHDIQVTFFIIFLLLIISSSLMYFLEHESQPTVFSSIPTSLWWGVCTLTTIGYGDIVPITIAGKICTAIIALLGISAFALPSGIIVTGLIEEMNIKKEETKTIIYCPYCNEKLPH
ncbi:MAG: ion transporter [bacterium]